MDPIDQSIGDVINCSSCTTPTLVSWVIRRRRRQLDDDDDDKMSLLSFKKFIYSIIDRSIIRAVGRHEFSKLAVMMRGKERKSFLRDKFLDSSELLVPACSFSCGVCVVFSS